MAGGNISPRQKMINMMYLVLTALLALNVSAEILKAFHLVEVSLEKSAGNIDTKNASVMKAIDKYHGEFPNDANGTDIWNKAKKARDIANDAVKYVEEIKTAVVAGAEGRKEDSNGDGKVEDEEVQKADDIENHANMLINNGKGKELRDRINKTREDLLALLKKDQQSGIKSDLVTQDFKVEGSDQSWESVMFEHSPAAAVITLLTKIQGDIRNTEAQVLDVLKASISESDFTFDKLEAKVIPNFGTYITEGGKYSADIFVAASSSKQQADITVNGGPVKVVDGVGKYEVTASGEGEKKYKAVITAKKPNGQIETFSVEQTYMVLKPLAVISATKMNVVYIGLDNPISVSVPGYAPTDVQVTASAGGTLVPDKAKGTYLLKVSGTAREITVTASVKDKSGAVKKMGEQKYRVRQVPDPIPQLGSIKASGRQPAGVVKSAQFALAILENFAYEGIKYTPTEFQLGIIPKVGQFKGFRGTGQALTPQMRAALNSLQSGDKVMLAGMKVTGPGGARPLPSVLVIDIQ